MVAVSRSFAGTLFGRYPPGDILTIRLPLAILLALPLFAPMLLPTASLLSLAITAAIFLIVANGLHVIFGYAGQLSLAHTTLWGLGAYTAALLTIHYGWPTAALIPAAGFVGAVGAVAIGIPAFRTAGFSFAIMTFAFAEIMLLVGKNWTSLTNGTTGLTVLSPASSIGSIQFDKFDHLTNFYYLTLAFAYLSLVGIFLIRQSSLGRTLIAIRENESLARSVGINVYLYKLIAFAISGFFAGVAGVFFMYHFRHIEPGQMSPFGAFLTIQFLLMILIGGRFSMLGPTIGAVIAVFAPKVINALLGFTPLDDLSPARIQIIFGSALVLTVLFSPNGVVGQSKARYGAVAAALQKFRERQGSGAPPGAAAGE